MCMAPKIVSAAPQVMPSQAPTPTEAKVGDEKAVKLAKKERDVQESGLEGMKVTLNAPSTGNPSGTPGGTVSS